MGAVRIPIKLLWTTGCLDHGHRAWDSFPNPSRAMGPAPMLRQSSLTPACVRVLRRHSGAPK